MKLGMYLSFATIVIFYTFVLLTLKLNQSGVSQNLQLKKIKTKRVAKIRVFLAMHWLLPQKISDSLHVPGATAHICDSTKALSASTDKSLVAEM